MHFPAPLDINNLKNILYVCCSDSPHAVLSCEVLFLLLETPFLSGNLPIPSAGNSSGKKQTSQAPPGGLIIVNPLPVSHSITIYRVPTRC